MLQQTRMEVVLPYFQRFMARFPDLASLAAASSDEVMTLWSGLGYYRRAAMLQRGVRYVAEELGGVIPHEVPELLQIPGVGPYTAGAIASIAFDRPAAIVDGNVTRVLARLEAMEEESGSGTLRSKLWDEAKLLVDAAESPRMLNQSLMELGALICTPLHPSCLLCPVQTLCEARRGGVEQELPKPKRKRAVEQLEIALFVVCDAKGRVLLQREHGELMNGMFHFPHGSDALLRDSSALFRSGEELGTFRHTITHRAITFRLVRAEAKNDALGDATEAVWIDPRGRLDVPHPSYVMKAMKLLRKVES